jgi:DNA-directed RNA polymerases I, II, and III subunit RPABC3
MANVVSDSQLFEDNFIVHAVDQSKYDRAARLSARSLDNQTALTLDINTELFPCREGETLQVVLATTLALDGTKDDDKGWRDVAKGTGEESTLADMFDYVCYGKTYKFEDGGDGQTRSAAPSDG